MLKSHSVQSFFVKVGVGIATLAALVTAKPWKSAEIGTTQNFKYGAFEGRMMTAQGSGMISTFFLWKNGSEVPGAQWQEQDFEMWGKNGLVQSQCMTPGAAGTGEIRTEHTGIHTLPTKAWERYYTYRMEWTPKYLAFYINGTLVRKETDTAEYRKLMNPALAEPMQLRTGIWAGDFDWSGPFDSTFVPQGHFVNWVKVYSYTPGTGTNGSDFTPLWTENFNTSIDWTRWTPSNWTFEYSVADYVPANNGIRNGTLVQAITRWQTEGTLPPAPLDDGLEPPLTVGPALDPSPVAIPATIPAQQAVSAYDLTAGNGGDAICATLNPNIDYRVNGTTGTCYVTQTQAGEWVEYLITTSVDLNAEAILKVGNEVVDQTIHLELDGVKIGSSIVFRGLGGTTWSYQQVPGLMIPAGIHTLRVVFETGKVNLSSIQIKPTNTDVAAPIAVPGQLEATNYARYFDLTTGNAGSVGRIDGVDKEYSQDGTGGLNVGWTGLGEWLEYDIAVASAAFFDLNIRVASAMTTSTVKILVDGVDVSGSILAPSNGWQAFKTFSVPSVPMTAGTHVVKVLFETGGANYRSLNIVTSQARAPLAVTGLSAAAGDASVQLSWNPSVGASAYNVLRDGAVISTVSTTSFLDLTVLNGTEYAYSVVATNAVGDAPASVSVTATPKAPLPPSVPTALTAIAGNGIVDLAWVPSTNAASYKVYRSLDGIAYTLLGATANAQYADPSVINGTVYTYQVTSVNGSLESAPSASVNATPRGVAPSQVTGLVATAGDALVDLAWTASAGATGYTIYRSVDGSVEAILTVVSAVSYQDVAVANGSTYTYTVVASNVWGDAVASAPASATPLMVPAIPTALAAVAGDAQVSLSWTPGTNDLTFNVYRAVGADAATKIATVATPSYLDATVINGTIYTYSVTGVNADLESAPSASVVAAPKGPAPAQVTGLVATAGNATVSLAWTASVGATSYKVLRSVAGGASALLATAASTDYTDLSVANGTVYDYSIVASNIWGDAIASSVVSASPDFPTPDAPTALAAVAANGSVALTWTAGANNLSFNVYRAADAGAASKIATSTTGAYTDAAVVNGTTYTYTVTGVNGTKESPASVSAVATPRGVAPVLVTGLVATAGNATVSLAWTASAGATSYSVLRSVAGGAATQVGTSTTASYTDATVTNGTAYTYTVVASNVWGSAAASAAVTATPDSPTPAAPTALSAVSGNATVALTWTAGANNVSYNVYRAVGAGVATKIGTSATASYTDATAVNGTTYTYNVTGVNGTKESVASNSVTATPAALTAKLKAQYKAGYVGATTNGIRPLLQIVNTGTTAVPLSQVTVRYWFTKDGATSQSYWCDWAQMGQTNIVGTFKTVSPVRTNADGYLELSFKTTAGNLAAGATTGEIQSRFSKSNWSNYTQTNDASYDATKSSAYADWTKVTVYVNGTLVWGVEP